MEVSATTLRPARFLQPNLNVTAGQFYDGSRVTASLESVLVRLSIPATQRHVRAQPHRLRRSRRALHGARRARPDRVYVHHGDLSFGIRPIQQRRRHRGLECALPVQPDGREPISFWCGMNRSTPTELPSRPATTPQSGAHAPREVRPDLHARLLADVRTRSRRRYRRPVRSSLLAMPNVKAFSGLEERRARCLRRTRRAKGPSSPPRARRGRRRTARRHRYRREARSWP